MVRTHLSTVEECFSVAQTSFAHHRRCIESLGMIRKASQSEFDVEFFACICCILPISKREPAIERLIEFIVQFATNYGGESETDDAFVQSLVSQLLEFTTSKDKSVRSRSTQLVGRVFNSMSEDAEVSDDLFEAVEQKMIARCRDKVPSVRAFAARALFRLQDPTNTQDEITCELLRLMADDSSKEVRMAAIATVAPSKHTIGAILERSRDVSPEVRAHAIKVFQTKVDMRWLSISQRSSLLSSTLVDRDPKVVSMGCEMLVSSWLHTAAENDVLRLLKALDVATHEVAAQRVMVVLLREKDTRTLVSQAAKQWDSTGPVQLEAIFCLRALLENLSIGVAAGDVGACDEFEKVAPELPDFCTTLSRVVEECEAAHGSTQAVRANFALTQLLSAGAKLDVTNEHGRSQLEQLLSRLIKSLSTPEEMLPALFDALSAAHPNGQESFQRLILELISEIEEPLEADYADLSVETCRRRTEAETALQREQRLMLAQARLGEVRGQIKAAVDEEDFDQVHVLKKEAVSIKAEIQTLSTVESDEVVAAQRTSRGLRLAGLLLRSPSLLLAEHELSELPARFLPSIQSPSPEHRSLAIKCLGLTCTASMTQAKLLFPVFLTSVRHDQQDVQIAALRAMFDLLLAHTPGCFFTARPPTHNSTPDAPLVACEDAYARDISELLMPILVQSHGAVQRVAVEGLCKLVHVGALRSTSLLARLLLMYFQADSPEVNDDLRAIKQVLAVFFMAGSDCTAICAALIPALRISIAAPPGSMDAEVDVDSMINFVIALSKPSTEGDGSGCQPNLHEHLAMVLTCEAALASDETEGKLLPKALLQLSLHESSASTLAVLDCLLHKIAGKLVDKHGLKNLTKAIERVQGLRRATSDQPSEVSPMDAAALAESALEAQRASRDADVGADARQAERLREAEEVANQQPRPTTKDKRKLARLDVTPGHLGFAKENTAINAIEV